MNKISCLFFLLLFSSAKLFGETLVLSGHPNYPPFTWENEGKLYGIGVELSQLILKELKRNHKVQFTGPWKRVQRLAKAGEIDLIVSLYKNEARSSYLTYSQPYMTEPTNIFVKKGKEFKFKTKEDLKNKIGITILGDSYGQALDEFIHSKLKMDWISNPLDGISSILYDRADYFLWGYYPCRMFASKHALLDKIVALPIPITHQQMYLAVSKRSPLAKELPKINEIIQKLVKTGKVEALKKKYQKIYTTQ